MLATDDRLLLTDALAPPLGYTLDRLIGTSYSLDLAALLTIPLGLTFSDWEQADGLPSRDPVAALESVRRYADRITVFCQAGGIGVIGQPPLVASWLEEAVVPVSPAGDGGVFHPKVMVARYTPLEVDANPRFRVICGSRNITFDRSWDTVVVLDGGPTPRGGRERATDPLADFVEALPALASGTVSPERQQHVRALARELRRVRFSPPDGFSALAFHPLGITGHRADPFTTRTSRLLVVSPFLGASRIGAFQPESTDNLLVTRAEEAAAVGSGSLGAFNRICAIDEPLPEDGATSDGLLRGLHAKLYVADDGWDAHVWTGSANATSAAFKDNVEFLVRLDGRRKSCGVEAVLGRPDDAGSLAALLSDITPPEEPAEPSLEARLEREVDDLLHDLAARAWTARISDGDSGHDVALHADPNLRLAGGALVHCWPMTSSRERHPTPVKTADSLVATFPAQPLESLTAFFAVEVELTRDGITKASAGLITAELLGLPAGRREAILRQLLSDPEQLLRFLRALLTMDGDGLPGTDLLEGASGNGSAWRTGDTPLLEALLKALEADPARIGAIADLLDGLKGVHDDVLPPRFIEVWEPVRAVYEERKRRP
jgi:hypothetical protein